MKTQKALNNYFELSIVQYVYRLLNKRNIDNVSVCLPCLTDKQLTVIKPYFKSAEWEILGYVRFERKEIL